MIVPRFPAFERVVLLFGSGRSGTTFLAKLIDSSPRVLYRHEPDAVVQDSRIPFQPERETYDALRPLCEGFVQAMLARNDARSSGSLPLFDKAFRSASGNLGFRLALMAAKAAERVGLDLPVPGFVPARARPVALIKSVNSVCRAPLIASTFPEVRVLHLVRHPGAVADSLLRGAEQGKMAARTYLKAVLEMPESRLFPFNESDVEGFDFARQAAYGWMVRNEKVHRELAGREGYRLVVYEDLCRNVEARSREIFDFIGLPMEAQTRGFIDTVTSSESTDARYFSVVRNVTSSIDKWRSRSSPEQVEGIEDIITHSQVGRAVLDACRADRAAS